MTNAQGWTLLAMVGVLLSVIGGLMVNQFHMLRGYLDARFEAVDARFAGLESSIDARFEAVDARFDRINRRFDHLDRDVQALFRDRFGRDS